MVELFEPYRKNAGLRDVHSQGGLLTNPHLGFDVSRVTFRHDYITFKITFGGGHRIRDVGLVMNRFGYSRDPIFLVALSGYMLNRWLLQPLVASPFLHGHFNDLLLMPAALPVIIWMQRLVGLRKHDCAPSWTEMWMHFAVWSLICEFIGPFFFHHGTADLWDVAAYATGGIAACLWWNRLPQRVPVHQP